MLKIIGPSERVLNYIAKRGLTAKYLKQTGLLSSDLHYPGLNVERLEPKSRGIYSFRVDKQFRGFFIYFSEKHTIKIFDVNNHYK